MDLHLMLFCLLAQGGGAGNPSSGFVEMVPLFAILMLLFYFMIIRPQKNREKDFRSLRDNLKKNDRVYTIGGIFGVVTNVQKDVERVTIRIDETNGSTIRVRTSAIAEVVTDESKADGDGSKAKAGSK